MIVAFISLAIGVGFITYSYVDYKKAKDKADKAQKLLKEIQRRCDRNEELIMFVIELQLKGFLNDALLLQEDVQNNFEKIDKLKEELNKICK